MTIGLFRRGILNFLTLLALHIQKKAHGSSHVQTRTANLDTNFSIWPDETNIRFCIDSYYTATEAQYIRDAATEVSNNLNGCVQFKEIQCSDTLYKIHVSPYDENGVLQTFCYSYPGQNNVVINKGINEQRMVVTRGSYGCLDGVKHTLMRYFTIVLGKRNEHQRGDRDQYITVSTTNLGVPNAYRKYGTNEAYWALYPYDFCSITHNQPTDFALPGSVAFSVIPGPYNVPKLNQLSNTDCQILSRMYGCPVASCPALDCAAQQLQLASTCDPTTMCTGSPDESTYLIGPYQFYQTFLLFKGGCVLEYTYDYLTGNLLRNVDSNGQQISPQATSTYFHFPGGPTFTPPIVDLAYMTYNPATGGNSYMINVVNRQTGKQLTCPSNGAFSSGALAVDCPTAATTSGSAVPLSKATSASSQQFQGVPLTLYQYVVLPGDTEIGLMDATFTTLYSQTTNFLAGQSSIVKITAIQIMQDEKDPQQNVRFGIFGVGADGVTPYFGYVNMLVTAVETLSLSDPVVLPAPNPGERWVAEPKLLRTVLQGC
ncbi:uncharacterized protein LOC129588547 [Paramacrobiotus metropolitanus]|uniref:uncharacterized protein LOC129588547 n=1 Tax=Paramacrobiotus metropolitanus TaxID=2943436 RepID=UPI0024456868|nr:uncharacterized protein LOC129588547 [Paramacrobiotus metropolitanus]